MPIYLEQILSFTPAAQSLNPTLKPSVRKPYDDDMIYGAVCPPH